MGTLLIDKLLSAAVKQGASDLHITVGQPPVLRLHGRLQRLKTKVLEPAETLAMMNCVTPSHCLRERQETGSTQFSFGFGDVARFAVSVAGQDDKLNMRFRRLPTE